VPPKMKQEELNEMIRRFSDEIGMPQKEIRRLCLRAGLELLEKGELRITRGKVLQEGDPA